MATYTLIEVNGDYAHRMDDENFGSALYRVIQNPSNMQMMEEYGFDIAVRVVGTSMKRYNTPAVHCETVRKAKAVITREALIKVQLEQYPDSKIMEPQDMYAWYECDLNFDKLQEYWMKYDAVLYPEPFERREAWRHYCTEKKLRWHEQMLGCVLNCMRYPIGVFYQCGLRENGRYEWKGFRFGLEGSQYVSVFPGELG
jgi:hypothetical protein